MDYAVANLADPTSANGIVKASLLFPKFNFDMLKALVEEMNRYGESAMDSLKFLNIKPDWEQSQGQQYTLTAEFKNDKGDDRKVTRRWTGNPLAAPIEFQFYDNEDGEHYEFIFDVADVKRMDAESGQIMYESDEAKVFIERVEKRDVFNWAAV
jgi:hypothetical protein